MIDNIDAEKHVIASVILDQDCLLEVLDIIQPNDFNKTSHTKIINACLDIYQDGMKVDLISLTERLRIKGELEEIGGASYLSGLLTDIPISANIKHHAKIVKEKSLLRNINIFSKKIQNKSESGHSVKDIVNYIEKNVLQFSGDIDDQNNSPHIDDIIDEVKKNWEMISKGEKVYIPADFMFAEVLPQYMPGDIIMIGGYTSVGKSTLLAQMILDICEEGGKCLIFSTEDSKEDKVIKLISNIADIPQKYLMVGDLLSTDKINDAINKIKRYNIKIYDDVDNIDDMRLKIKKHKIQEGVDIVAIDYIQNISGEGGIYEKLANACRKMQKFAKELNITCIVLSQMSNEAMKGDGEIIGLKGAGELASVPDIVFELYRVKGEGKERFLDCHVKKNRPFSTTGVVRLQFSDKWTRIEKRFVK